MIVRHLKTFLDRVGVVLQQFSEQTGESAHQSMAKMIARYCRREEHEDHGQQLLRAVAQYIRERL